MKERLQEELQEFIDQEDSLEEVKREKKRGVLRQIKPSKDTKNYLRELKIFQKEEIDRLIEDKNILVDGDKFNLEKPVTGSPTLKIRQSKNFPYPIPESYKLFLFNKPRGLICD